MVRTLQIPRRACPGCRATWGVLPPEVVRRHRYARAVIATALARRQAGWSWERCAAGCTAEGLVATRVVRRWAGHLEPPGRAPQGTPFPPAARGAMLAGPAVDRSPDLRHRDPWERSPPIHP